MKKNTEEGREHLALAKMTNLSISTKHGIEISKYLRHKNTSFAKKFLEDVIALKKPVPFKTFDSDVGHKAGMAAGRYPQKAAKEFLRLVKSAEANAQFKGLDVSNLEIVKLLTNKASIPFSGGRRRHGTKRSHIEISVKEGKQVKKKSAEKINKEIKSLKKSDHNEGIGTQVKNKPVDNTEIKVQNKAESDFKQGNKEIKGKNILETKKESKPEEAIQQ